MRRIVRNGACAIGAMLAALLLPAVSAPAQILERLSVDAATEAVLPVLGDETFYDTGFGESLTARLAVLPFLFPFLDAGVIGQPIKGLDTLLITRVGLGAGLAWSPVERLQLAMSGKGGAFVAYRGESRAGNFYLGAGAEVGYRISPSLSVSAHAGISRYLGNESPLLSAATAGLSVTLHLGGLPSNPSRVRIENVQAGNVYPVFYSYYDDHSFGSATVTNGQENEIRDVRVSFSMSQYMVQPKLCATFASIPRGASVTIPMLAIFNDEVLSLTENSRVPGDIVVDYNLLGSPRQVRTQVVLQFLHRNAMTWDDDRKAAAFVSPTDPAALWFAKFVGGIVRDRLRVSINQNLQLAIGLFEAGRLYGLNYVVDPSSSFVEKSASSDTVDYLQYPHQTLLYRGGDCDDLSILYATLLESVGIKTAFVTIPGHIFMAFSLGVSEAEARATFFDPSLLIFREGQAWAPVEITMVKEGFVKAWRIGAKEWVDNDKTGAARLFPMSQSWTLYAPVGIPDINPRFTLPERPDLVRAFDESVDRYVAREIDPAVAALRGRPGTQTTPETSNRLGILYGEHAMLKDAWTQFSQSAKADYPSAWTNLGSVAFLRGDYTLALTYYQWALRRDPRDAPALLGVARATYELEQFTEAEQAYGDLKALAPGVAAKYGYLASYFGGEGRAWSFADRLSSTVWSVPSTQVAVQAPAQAPAEEAPAVAVAPVAPPPVEEAPAVASAPAAQAPGEEAPAVASVPAAPPPAEIVTIPPSASRLAAEAPGFAPGPAVQPPVEEAPVVALVPAAPPPAAAAPATAPVVRPPEIAEQLPGEIDTTTALEAPAATVAVTAPAPQVPAGQAAPPIISAAPPVEVDRFAIAPAQAPAQVPAQEAAAPAPQVAAPAPQAEAPARAAEEPAGQPEAAAPEAPVEPVAEPEQQASEPAVETPLSLEMPAAQEPVVVALVPAEQPPVAAPAQEQVAEAPRSDLVLLLEGFGNAYPALGAWTVDPAEARQASAAARFAKLVTPMMQPRKPLRYSFRAQSTGAGWVGLGIHLFVDPIQNYRGYGGGNSVLVWLTRDPQHYGDTQTRLQVYRSVSNTAMRVVEDVVVPESVLDSNSVAIDFDPVQGRLSVSLNGSERLSCAGLTGLGNGVSIVFRALNKAQFQDFRVEELP